MRTRSPPRALLHTDAAAAHASAEKPWQARHRCPQGSSLARPGSRARGSGARGTGWRAKVALAHTFAPGNYGPSVVGSLYALRATQAGRLRWELRGAGSDIVSAMKVWGVEFWPRPELSLDKTKITWIPGLGVCAAIAILWLGILGAAIFELLEVHARKKNLTNIAVYAVVLLLVVGAALVKLVNRLYEWH